VTLEVTGAKRNSSPDPKETAGDRLPKHEKIVALTGSLNRQIIEKEAREIISKRWISTFAAWSIRVS